MEITLHDLKELIGQQPKEPSGNAMTFPFGLGGRVFVRTLSYHYVGKIYSLSGHWLVLEQASWVADSGRFSTALREGKLAEYEAYPDQVVINLNVVVDISVWVHELPKESV